MRYFALLCCFTLVTTKTVSAAFVTPSMGGSQAVAPMKHVDISFSGGTISVQVDNSVTTPLLQPLEAPDEFDPGATWGVLGTKAYNFQYGWNAGGFIIPPANGWIWIEQLSATPGLEVYQRPPASPAYDPVFGTAGSSLRWRWSGSMTHNVYAVQDPSLSFYEADYRIYIGDDFTGEPLLGYTPAEISFRFSASPLLHADFDGDDDVDGQDLLQWEGDFALNGNSDADGDGDSDGVDFLVWQREMGSDNSPAIVAAVVPEPGSGVIVIVSVLVIILCHRNIAL